MASSYPSRVELPLVFPEGLDDSIFGDDSCTVIISVLRCEHLAPCHSVFGNQLQRTSYKPSTVDPEWVPYERFQFTTTNMSSREIRLYAYHKPARPWKEPSCLGYSTIALPTAPSTPTAITLPLISTDTSHNDGKITVEIHRIPAREGMVRREDVIYEYERYSPFLNWGNTYPGHLLPTDKGRYSDGTGQKFSLEMEDVMLDIPAEWGVLRHFRTVNDDWEYAFDIISNDWYPESRRTGCCVRRRQWLRLLTGPTPKPLPDIDDEDSTVVGCSGEEIGGSENGDENDEEQGDVRLYTENEQCEQIAGNEERIPSPPDGNSSKDGNGLDAPRTDSAVEVVAPPQSEEYADKGESILPVSCGCSCNTM